MPWTIAGKDFKVLRRKRVIVYTLIVFPLFIAIGLPALVWLLTTNDAVQAANMIPYFNAFDFLFIMVASFLPSSMASYSIVGEKVAKSLEPLLATPVTDGEILFGKSLASFLPSMGATYLGGAIYMVLIDVVTRQQLGYLYYPNWTAAVFFLLAAPLACLFSVALSVIVSARVTDVRAADQFGRLLVLPFAALYVLGEINIVPLVASNLLILSAVLLVVDAILLFISQSTFRREEILTKWK
jgi:ABC-type Na+ efflux pump permease subunit